MRCVCVRPSRLDGPRSSVAGVCRCLVEQGGRCRPVFVQLACWDVQFTYILRVYTFATTDHANPWRTDLDPTQAHSRWAERCTDASSSLGCTHMSRSGAGQGHESQRCSTRSFNSSGSSAARRRRVGGAGQDPAHRGAATEAGCGRFMWRGERTGARSYHHQGPRISFELHDQSILFTSSDGADSSTTSGRST